MRKHLSVLGLAARGAVGRILLITVLTAALAGALLYLVPALALTIGGFFPRMGAASTFIWAFVAAAGAGLCVVLLQKGETEDAEKQDFRVRQDA